MQIFDRAKRHPALLAAIAVGISAPLLSGTTFAAGPKAVDSAVVSAAADVAAVPVKASAAAVSGQDAAVTGTSPAMLAPQAAAPKNSDELSPAERSRRLFRAGVDAYNAGDGVLTVENWQKAADLGNIAAQWNLARLYRRDDLVAADPVKSLNYIRIVADQHDPNRIRDARSAMTVAALVELAGIYRKGLAEAKIEADPRRAARLYELAATLYGDARAQHQLGMMYLTGEGVSQQIGRAVRWLALSARKRYAPSLAALGDYFWNNRAEGNNKVQSLMWLSLARENAKRDDIRELVKGRYEEALTEANDEERKRAMALIQNWNQGQDD